MEDSRAVFEEIKNITKLINGVKITTSYLISTDLYKINTDKLIELVTDKLVNHPATIVTITGTPNNDLQINKKNLWKIKSNDLILKSKINESINKYIDLYFIRLEKSKQYFLNTNENYTYTKIVFTPFIEVYDAGFTLYFYSLTIFSNGTIVIELFEDLKELFYGPDFYQQISLMKHKFYPNFAGKNRTYINDSSNQLSDIKNYLVETVSSINGGIKFNELLFYVTFITNMDEMNKLKLFNKFKLFTWLVNAPYNPKSFLNGLSLDNHSEYLREKPFSFEPISYISKGINYIVWSNESHDEEREKLFLRQASVFLTAATPFFQLSSLEETIYYSLEKFKINNKKQLLKFNEWSHKYRKSLIHIYRSPSMGIINLFTHLRDNSDLKVNDYLKEIENRELKLIQAKYTYIEETRNKLIEIILFIISNVSVLQVINIFTNNKCYLLLSAVILIITSIIIFIYKNFKNT